MENVLRRWTVYYLPHFCKLLNMDSHNVLWNMPRSQSDYIIRIWWVKCSINMRRTVPCYLMLITLLLNLYLLKTDMNIWLCPDAVKASMYPVHRVNIHHPAKWWQMQIWKYKRLFIIICFCNLEDNESPKRPNHIWFISFPNPNLGWETYSM